MSSQASLCRIKVEGLPQNLSLMSASSLFNKYGCVANLVSNGNNYIVQYQTNEQAKKAISALDGNTTYSALKKLHACFVISKKPDCLAIFNIYEDEIPAYNNLLKAHQSFTNLVTLRTSEGYVPFAVAFFSKADLNAIIKDLVKNDCFKKRKYITAIQNFEPTQENMIKTAKSFEERTVCISCFCTKKKLTEQQINEHLGGYKYTKILENTVKYDVPYVLLLMESKESAKNCTKEMNSTYINGLTPQQRFTPFLLRNLPHEEAGLLVINELTPELCRPTELYEVYGKFGEILSLAVCPCAKSLVCCILFRRYDDAFKAKFKMSPQNALLFPRVNAVKALRSFEQQASSPNLTLVTYNNKSKADLVIRRECSINKFEKSVIDFFTISVKTTKIAVATYANIPSFAKAKEQCMEKKASFDIIGTSTLVQVFDMFTDIPIEAFWVNKIFYATGASENLSNFELREAFSKIAPVEAVINLTHLNKALVLFSSDVDKKDPRLLSILPNGVFLEDVLNKIEESQTTRSLSQGELNTFYLPGREIITEITKRDPSLVPEAEEKLKRMSSNEIITISTDQKKMNEFCDKIVMSKKEEGK